ncbi:MAG: glycine cleavage system protein GcvH [Candidatus Ranarchaeia archaeon]
MMKVGDYEVKEGVYYTKKHEWARVSDDVVLVGITDYAQQALGEITFIDIRGDAGPVNVGDTLKRGDKYAEVESHKAVEDVFTPIGGIILEINESLQDAPNTINDDPYGAGWILKIKAEDIDSQLKELLDADAYAEVLKSEAE